MHVPHALRVLLNEIIDYAGMFPPASLPLEAAIGNFAAYRSDPRAWMLSRFVCPAARLAELGPYVSRFNDDAPLTISALGRASQSAVDFLSALSEILTQATAFRSAHGARVSVDAIEMPLPPDAPVSAELLASAADSIEASGLPRVTPFFESKFDAEWREVVASTADAMAAHNRRWQGERCRPAGFKLRTGGVAADAFPPPEQIAAVIVACRERGIALKCTAGLHHPLRRFDASVQARVHGFLNVFVAGVLAHARGLGAPELQAIIEDEQAAHFQFDEDGLEWNGVRAARSEIANARRDAVVSFGSCSFDEPRDDLRALGWLPAA